MVYISDTSVADMKRALKDVLIIMESAEEWTEQQRARHNKIVEQGRRLGRSPLEHVEFEVRSAIEDLELWQKRDRREG